MRVSTVSFTDVPAHHTEGSMTRFSATLAGVILVVAIYGGPVAGQTASGQADFAAGSKLFQAGDYKEAAPRLERAIAGGLDLADRIRAREWVAVCYFALNLHTKAAESIQALVKEAPSYEPSATLPPDVR